MKIQANVPSGAFAFLLFLSGTFFRKAVYFSPKSNCLDTPHQSGLTAFILFFFFLVWKQSEDVGQTSIAIIIL